MSLFGGGTTATSAASQAAQAQGDTTNDIPLQSPPEDSISDISFSSMSEHLAVASWDKKVRIYEITADGNSVGKAMFEHDGPVLSVTWSKACAPRCAGLLAYVTYIRREPTLLTDRVYRMEPRLSREVPTSRQSCSTSRAVSRRRWLPTTSP